MSEFHLGHQPVVARNSSRHLAAENAGQGPDIRSVFDRFLGSPDHRRNILNPDLTRVRIGVVSRDGQVWVTMQFLGSP